MSDASCKRAPSVPFIGGLGEELRPAGLREQGSSVCEQGQGWRRTAAIRFNEDERMGVAWVHSHNERHLTPLWSSARGCEMMVMACDT